MDVNCEVVKFKSKASGVKYYRVLVKSIDAKVTRYCRMKFKRARDAEAYGRRVAVKFVGFCALKMQQDAEGQEQINRMELEGVSEI